MGPVRLILVCSPKIGKWIIWDVVRDAEHLFKCCLRPFCSLGGQSCCVTVFLDAFSSHLFKEMCMRVCVCVCVCARVRVRSWCIYISVWWVILVTGVVWWLHLPREGICLLIWLNEVFYSEKAMVPHSSTLAWKIPWAEEPGRLQSMGSLRVGHDWATSLSLFTLMHWRRKWQPTPVFLPRESQGWGSLVGCHLWGRMSRTRLKRLSSSKPYLTFWHNRMLQAYIVFFQSKPWN